MSVKSKIEWCDSTINSSYGCTKCGPACAHCYAQRMAERFSLNPGVANLFEGTVDFAGNWTDKINLFPERMEQALHWRKPRRIFVGSMTDLFHPAVPFEFLDRVFAVMALAPWHTFMLLTKRPGRMREYMERRGQPGRLQDARMRFGGDRMWDEDNAPQWPLPNVWLGTTVWDQASANANIPELLGCPAAVRFVSVEPMLGPMDLPGMLFYGTERTGGVVPLRDKGYPQLDWIICGGETGPGARPMHPDWVRSLRDQCQQAEVPFFFKSWGEWGPRRMQKIDGAYNMTNGRQHWETDPTCKGGMRRVGKKAAGRVLDGRTWEQFPEVGA